jgi:hypothetical protein
MNEYGEESRLPYINIKEGDAGVLVGLPLMVLVITTIAGFKILSLVATAAALGIGLGVVYVTPEYVSAWTWLTYRLRHMVRPRVTLSAVDDPVAEDLPQNEGGFATYLPFTPDESTQDLTNVERAWPGAGTIQRSDGVMEAFLEIDPGNMDFAMLDDWQHLQENGAEFANTKLDYPLKFHATTRTFPVEEIVERIDDRLTDEDVKANPRFQALLEEYREKRPREMRDRGTQQMRYFIGVEVNQLEVYNRSYHEPTPAEKLTSLPVIGFLFISLITRREHPSEAEIPAKIFSMLDERVQGIETDLIQPIEDWSSRRLSTVELFVLAMEFWNGEEYATEFEDPEQLIRHQPVIGRQPRTDGDADGRGTS